MDAEPLAAACELAFAVAREGEKAVPPVEPPASMRNYLYVAQLPRRAMTVAQRAIDEDPAFRRRVAAQATEQGLGRTGFLWLTRPSGWETDGQTPSDEVSRPPIQTAPNPAASPHSPIVPAVPDAPGPVPVPPRPAPPVPAPSAPTPPVPAPSAPTPQVPMTPQSRPSAPPLPAKSAADAASQSPSASSIEDELASLRGLVDQLSAERHRLSGTAETSDDEALDPASGAPDGADLPEVSSSAEPDADVQAADAVSQSDSVMDKPVMPTRLDPADPLPGPVHRPDVGSVPPVPKPPVKQAAPRPSGLPIPPVPKPTVAPSQPLTSSTVQDVGASSAELQVAKSKVASLDGQLGSATVRIADLEAELEAARSNLARAESAVVTAQVDVADIEGAAAEASRLSEIARLELNATLEAAQLEAAGTTAQLEAANTSEATLRESLDLTKLELAAATDDLALAATQSADLIAERDLKSSELDDLRHDYSVAAGAMVERDHLRESLDATTHERDELSGKLEVAEQARIDLELELDQMSSKWQSLQVELASARSSLTGTRGVFESSMQEIGDELAKTESILESSAPEDPSFVALGQDHPEAAETTEAIAAETTEAIAAETTEVFEATPNSQVATGQDPAEVAGSLAVAGEAPSTAEPKAETPLVASAEADSLVSQPIVDEAVLDQPEIDLPVAEDLVNEAEVAPALDPVADPFVPVDVSGEFGVDPQAWIGSPDDVVERASDETADPSAFAAADSEALSELVEAVGQPEDVPESPALSVESSDLSTMLDTYGLGAEDSYAGLASSPQSADAPGHELRQQIEIPASIAGDPLGIIRHVVAAEDVVILVDGDAVAEMGWPETGVAVRREALVKYLGDLAADTGAAQDTVFSGSLSEGDELPVSRAVRVRITAPGVRPADALAELVDSYPQEWPVAVVSDDTELGVYASTHGATVLANGQLLDLLFDRWEASQTDE